MGRLLLHTLADSGQRVYSDKSIFQAIFTIAYHCCILVLTCTLFLLISGSQVRVLVRPPNSPQNTVCYALGGKLPDGAVSVPVWCPQEGLSAPCPGAREQARPVIGARPSYPTDTDSCVLQRPRGCFAFPRKAHRAIGVVTWRKKKIFFAIPGPISTRQT